MSLLGNVVGSVLTNYVERQRGSIANAVAPAGRAAAQYSNNVLRGPGLVAMPGSGFQLPRTISSQAASLRPRKRRRTNPTNVHALRRALRRVEGFIKIEKRVDKIVNRLKPRARAANKSGFVRRKR